MKPINKDNKTPAEYQKMIRIRLLLCAYAYEIKFHSFISDEEFDLLCLEVDLSVNTGSNGEELWQDRWFCKYFDPSTGMWIHRWPDLPRIQQMVNEMTAYKET